MFFYFFKSNFANRQVVERNVLIIKFANGVKKCQNVTVCISMKNNESRKKSNRQEKLNAKKYV